MADRTFTASLVIDAVDHTAKIVDGIGKNFRGLGTQLKNSLGMFGKADGFAKQADQLTKSLKTAEDAAKRVAGLNPYPKEFGAAFAKQLDMLKLTQRQVDQVVESYRRLEISGPSSRGIQIWKRETVGALKSVEAEQRKLEEVMKKSGGVGGATHYFGGGGILPFAGPGILHEAGKAVGAGMTYENHIAQMKAAGMSSAEIGSAESQASELSKKYRGLTKSDILELNKEARSVIQEKHEVGEATEIMANAKAAFMAVGDKEGADGVGRYVKGAEMLGRAKTAEEFKKYVDAEVKARQVMGTTITPEDQRQFAKQSKNAGMTLSDRFLFTTANSLSQELGGKTAGTELADFYQHVFSNHMSKQGFGNMVKAGLLDNSDVKMKAGGDSAVILPGHHIKGYETAKSDPDQWVYGAEAKLKAQGMNETERQAWWGSTFDRATADFALKMINQQQAFENHGKMYDGAMGLNATSLSSDNLTSALDGTKTALENLSATITAAATKDLAKGANIGTDALNSATGWFEGLQKTHPGLAGLLSDAGIGGSAAAGGYLSLKLFGGLARGLGGLFGLGGGAATAGAEALLPEATTSGLLSRLGLGGGAAAAALPFMGTLFGLGSLIKSSADAQKPGGGGMWAPLDPAGASSNYGPDRERLAYLHAQADEAQGKIDAVRAHTFGGVEPTPAALGPLPGNLADLHNAISLLEGSLNKANSPAAPVDVTGKVNLEGKADVNVRVTVEGGRVSGANANSSGNIQANVGVSMPHASHGPH